MAVLLLTWWDMWSELWKKVFLFQRLYKDFEFAAVIIMAIEPPHGLNVERTTVEMIDLPVGVGPFSRRST
jgi:hypothetical protein